MENKQTAVEWLILKCKDSLDREPIDATQQEIGYSKALNHIIILLEEAKQMEKEHIMMAYNDGRINQGLKQNKNSGQYYNETYGK